MRILIVTFMAAIMVIAAWFSLDNQAAAYASPLLGFLAFENIFFLIVAGLFLIVVLVTCFVILRHLFKGRDDEDDADSMSYLDRKSERREG